MKKFFYSISAVVLAAVLFVGCAGFPTPNSNNLPAELALTQAAACTGTQLTLQSQPQDAIYFIGAEQALRTVASGTNAITVTTVSAGLTAAGVTNPIVATAIVEAISIGDAYISGSTTNTSAQFVLAQQFCGATADGIHQGLVLAGRATIHKK